MIDLTRGVRRAERAVTDKQWIEQVLREGQILSLALATPHARPYVVPMGYGYEDSRIYLHGAAEGLKKELAEANPCVCFNVSIDAKLVRKETGSGFTYHYRSVTGFGTIRTLSALEEKNAALACLMRQYDGPHTDLTEQNHNAVWVAEIEIERMTGKTNGYPGA